MQIGMIGMGRMGANMTRRLMRGGHDCVVHDVTLAAVQALAAEGATDAATLDDFAAKLSTPRVVWLMVPAAVVDATLADLIPRLTAGDIVVDGATHFIATTSSGRSGSPRKASTTLTAGPAAGCGGASAAIAS